MDVRVPLLLCVIGFAVSFLPRVPRLREDGWLVAAGLLGSLLGAVTFLAGAAHAGFGAFALALGLAVVGLGLGGWIWAQVAKRLPNEDPVHAAFAFLLAQGFTMREDQIDPGVIGTFFESDRVQLVVERCDTRGFSADIGSRRGAAAGGDSYEDTLRRQLDRGLAPSYALEAVLRLAPPAPPAPIG